MNVLRNIVICSCIMLLGSCCGQTKEKAFLTKYEFEDFSQFNNADMMRRGVDRNDNICVFGYAPHLVIDSSEVGGYSMALDRNYQVVRFGFTQKKHHVVADTLKLQQLAQAFMKYEIPRLNVDEQGNVYVYLKDPGTLALVRFANEEELQKRSKETEWINIKHNWYRPR